MQNPNNTRGGRAGFALIVVLSSLLVLVFLFTISSKVTLRNAQLMAGEQKIGLRDHLNGDLLELAVEVLQSSQERPRDVFVSVGNMDYTIAFRDVGGFIDLNTAAPELRDQMFSALGLGPVARDAYIKWRQTGRRFARPEDFARVTGLDRSKVTELRALATVYSGRHGVALDIAPQAVLNVIVDRTQIPNTPVSGVNYRVVLVEDRRETVLGVVSAPPPPSAGYVLAF